ncbi:MAG: DUF2628 domain-containing protein [Methylophilaceae bacterium]
MTENNLSQANQSANETETFVGKNYAYYEKKWANAAVSSIKGFNVAAFFLGIIWLVYRKMYLYAAIVVGILIIDAVIESYFPLPEAMGKAVTWATAAVFGLLGNTWYKTHVDKKIAEIKATTPPEQIVAELAKRGGVNPQAAWALGIFFIIVIVLVIWVILNGG